MIPAGKEISVCSGTSRQQHRLIVAVMNKTKR
jgi:hypothetical protein